MTTNMAVKQKKPELFENDLSDERLNHYLTKPALAVDTETRGLNLRRDRLCLVQICDDEGVVSFVRFKTLEDIPSHGNSNLRKLLEAQNVIKIFHFARFDVSVLKYYLMAEVKPIWCTKIASRLVRTYTDRHSLRDVTRELIGIELDKSDQMSDWAREDLSESQLEYAANDVRVLLPLYKRFEELLRRENRFDVAQKLFNFLPTICELDTLGFRDMFEH